MQNSKSAVLILAVVAMLGTMLVAAGCQREATQTRPVETTSTEGSSTAPPSAEAERRDNALVRVVNAAPGVPAVDTLAGDNVAFSRVTYKAVTPYKELPDDRTTFRIRPAGKDAPGEPMAENSEGLAGGKHYTVVVMPGAGKAAELRVFNDNLTPPAEGKTRVRVIHAAQDAGEISVYARGREDAIVRGVDFQSAPRYDEIEPLSGPLQIKSNRDGKDVVVASVPSANFEAGKVYTVIVTGRPKGRLEAITIEDRFGADVAAEGAPAPERSRSRSAY